VSVWHNINCICECFHIYSLCYVKHSHIQFMLCQTLTYTVYVMPNTHIYSLCYAKHSHIQFMLCQTLTYTVYVMPNTHIYSLCYAKHSHIQFMLCQTLTYTVYAMDTIHTFRAVLKSSTNFNHCNVCLENCEALACNIFVSVSNFFWLM
jgi:hypothetical protein